MKRNLTFIYKIVLCFIMLGMGDRLFLLAQKCPDYYTNCGHEDDSFYLSAMSQGLNIHGRQKVSVLCVFLSGKENYISVCGEPGLGLLQFKILDYDTKTVLYNNAGDQFRQNIKVKVEVTTNIIIQVSAPAASFSSVEGNCAGLLIMYKGHYPLMW